MRHVYAIVLYNCACERARTIQTLLNKFNEISLNSEIIIYDNSPNNSNEMFCNSKGFLYLTKSIENSLREAYHGILSCAEAKGFEWVTLLDQDSEIGIDFHLSLMNDIKVNPTIGIKVPYVNSNLNRISPCKEYWGGYLRGLNFNENVLLFNKPIFAIGSFSTFNINILKRINFNESPFWIDSLDRWIYETLKNDKVCMNVIPVQVNHELSVISDNFVTLERYKLIVSSEFLFMKLFRSSFINYAFYFLRIIIRIFKLLIKRDDGIKYVKILIEKHCK